MVRCISLAVVAGLAATLLVQGSPAQETPVRVDHAPAGIVSTAPQMAAADGIVHLTWHDDRNSPGLQEVFYNRSLDHGNTWQATDLRLNTATTFSSRFPQIAAAQGAVHVAFDGAGGVRFNRSLDGGATWLGSDVLLGPLAANPLIAAAGPAVYVLYQRTTTPPFRLDLFLRRSLDQGTTWGPPVRVDTDPPESGDSLTPRLAASGSNVYVAWRDRRNGAADVYFNRSLDQGATFLASDVRLNTGVPAGTVEAYFNVELAASGNTVHVVWWDDRNAPGQIKRDVFANSSADAGTTWHAAGVRLDTDAPGSAESHFPHVAASGASAWVVWAEFRNGDGDVRLQRTADHGATWLAADQRIDNAPMGANSGVLQLEAGADEVYVAFQDDRNGGVTVYMNRSVDDGATWLPSDLQLSVPAAGVVAASLQEIAVDGDSVYVAWDDRGPGGGDCDVMLNIPLGFQPYGTGKPGTGGFVPVFRGSGLAALGETIGLDTSNGLGGATVILLAGGPGSNTAIPLLGGTILVSPVLSFPFALGGPSGVPGAGALSLPAVIPADPAFVGGVLYFQPIVLDPGVSFGVSMGNAIEFWIG